MQKILNHGAQAEFTHQASGPENTGQPSDFGLGQRQTAEQVQPTPFFYKIMAFGMGGKEPVKKICHKN